LPPPLSSVLCAPETKPQLEGGSPANRAILVIPCYNEAENLDLDHYESFALGGETDLLFVDDGSTDRTPELLAELEGRAPERIEVTTMSANAGKAEAVRHGVQRCLTRQPAFFGYWDADLATPLDELPRFREILDVNPALLLVMGSRVKLLGRTIDRKTLRHYGGRVFATLASMMLGLPVYDTQCGAKLFRSSRETRALFDEPFLTGWTFDCELLARLVRARRDSGGPPAEQSVYEMPLRSWRDVGRSNVGAADFFHSIVELARIRRHYLARER